MLPASVLTAFFLSTWHKREDAWRGDLQEPRREGSRAGVWETRGGGLCHQAAPWTGRSGDWHWVGGDSWVGITWIISLRSYRVTRLTWAD